MNYIETFNKVIKEHVLLKKENEEMKERLSTTEKELISLKQDLESLTQLMFNDFKWPTSPEESKRAMVLETDPTEVPLVVSETESKEENLKEAAIEEPTFTEKNYKCFGKIFKSKTKLVKEVIEYLIAGQFRTSGIPEVVIDILNEAKIFGHRSNKKVVSKTKEDLGISPHYVTSDCFINIFLPSGNRWSGYMAPVWSEKHFDLFRDLVKRRFDLEITPIPLLTRPCRSHTDNYNK